MQFNLPGEKHISILISLKIPGHFSQCAFGFSVTILYISLVRLVFYFLENYITLSLQIFNTISLSFSTCAIILQRKLKKLGKKFHKFPSPLSSTFIASETDSLFLSSPLILEINCMCAYLRAKLLHCPGLSFSFKDISLKFFHLLFSTINFFSLCKTLIKRVIAPNLKTKLAYLLTIHSL